MTSLHDEIEACLRGLLVAPAVVDVEMLLAAIFRGLVPSADTGAVWSYVAETIVQYALHDIAYSKLAAQVLLADLYRNTAPTFSGTCARLAADGSLCPDFYAAVLLHRERLDAAIVHTRDEALDYFGVRTLGRSYLLRSGGRCVERPQYLWMRVACAIHGGSGPSVVPGFTAKQESGGVPVPTGPTGPTGPLDLDAVLETYARMSQGYFTHASPTLFNAGTKNGQLASCFLTQIQEDSIEGIYQTLRQCAHISRHAGGIGLHLHTVRAKGSAIQGTGGTSNGLVPMLRVFNETARYVDQGGGKRKGSIAMYLEPWHADIQDFLLLRRNNGVEEQRTRDLFLGLWIPDLFMTRVEQDGMWSLFCPTQAPGLADVYGADFVALYTGYEAEEHRVHTRVRARTIWQMILDSQIETGVPYMLYKDTCNARSNQRHLGTLKCANLCTEIVQYTAPGEVAVCNLASVALPRFLRPGGVPFLAAVEEGDLVTTTRELLALFDFRELATVVALLCRNLNKVIDINVYPIREAYTSNAAHRPMGIGVQGWGDALVAMGLPVGSAAASLWNRMVFETMYFAALDESTRLARQYGAHASFPGSPLSEGLFHFELGAGPPVSLSGMWDWEALRGRVRQHGTRNSLFIAPMPTASTSQILGNSEGCEPRTSNVVVRRTLAGEFLCVAPYLVRVLRSRGLWTEATRHHILSRQGSVQGLEGLDAHQKLLFRTVWEIRSRSIIDHAAERCPFVDQSQSMSLFMEKPDAARLTAAHFYGWRQGLKTGMYYLRSRPAVDPIQFTVQVPAVCSRDNPGECLSCGS